MTAKLLTLENLDRDELLELARGARWTQRDLKLVRYAGVTRRASAALAKSAGYDAPIQAAMTASNEATTAYRSAVQRLASQSTCSRLRRKAFEAEDSLTLLLACQKRAMAQYLRLSKIAAELDAELWGSEE